MIWLFVVFLAAMVVSLFCSVRSVLRARRATAAALARESEYAEAAANLRQAMAAAQASNAALDVDPSTIPDDASSARWEAHHLFSVKGGLPHRLPWGVQIQEPPLAMVCPECDLKQPVLTGGRRRCGYCGVILHVHGTRLFWWRWPDQFSSQGDQHVG